jgi:hypothetical protein
MNAKNVLNRIATLLSLDAKEVNFTDAKTKDGTILQSPTFDVGEDVEVVAEDGTKTKAPDGEHEISLRDSEGNETLIKIMTMDGKIVERENVELPEAEMEMADATTEEAKGLPNTTDESDANEVATPDTENPIISLGYRIDELEKAMTEMKSMFAEMKPKEEVVDKKAAEIATEKDVEMELPKLDGAPIEQINRFSQENFNNFGKKTDNPQGSVLSKMYR